MEKDDLSPTLNPDLQEELYARHAEIKTFADMEAQRATPIPALFNMFFKFIQNPSTVSVETYKRMMDTDDTIGSGMDFLIQLLTARLGTYQHPSDEITAWVNHALKMTQGGWKNSVKEILSAMWAGHSATEQVWANTHHGFVIEKLVTLPPSSILYEVERTGELTTDGILQYQRNYNPAFLGGGGVYGSGFTAGAFNSSRPDPWAKFGDLPYPLRVGNTFQYLSIRIPTQKCIQFGYNGQGNFRSPYGRSLLRRAYNYWIMKNALLQMWATAMDRKGTPLLVVFADQNQTMIDSTKAPPGVNVAGRPEFGIRADVAAMNMFKNIHNDSVIVLPGKKDQIYSIENVQVTSNAQDFIASIDRCDKGSMRAMTIPALIFSAGDGSGSYALGQEHSKTFDKILDGHLDGFKAVLTEQHIQRLIRFNFPRSAWEKDGFGDFTKRDFTQDEIQKILEAYQVMQEMGGIDMNDLDDLNKVRETGGFAPRKTPIKLDLDEDGDGDDTDDDDKPTKGGKK